MRPSSQESPCRLLALSGSPRSPSQTLAVLELAAEGARRAGAEVEVMELGDAVGGAEAQAFWERLGAAAARADGLLIATPVYHDSFSGLLKLALDGLEEGLLEGKLAALISVGGGRFGNGLALEHLRTVLRAMGVWTLPRQVVLAQAADGVVPDELAGRLAALGREATEAALHLVRPGPAKG